MSKVRAYEYDKQVQMGWALGRLFSGQYDGIELRLVGTDRRVLFRDGRVLFKDPQHGYRASAEMPDCSPGDTRKLFDELVQWLKEEA